MQGSSPNLQENQSVKALYHGGVYVMMAMLKLFARKDD